MVDLWTSPRLIRRDVENRHRAILGCCNQACLPYCDFHELLNALVDDQLPASVEVGQMRFAARLCRLIRRKGEGGVEQQQISFEQLRRSPPTPRDEIILPSPDMQLVSHFCLSVQCRTVAWISAACPSVIHHHLRIMLPSQGHQALI